MLGGRGLSWQDGRTYVVAAGDCIVQRAGAEPHAIIAGDEGLDVLAFSGGSDTGTTIVAIQDVAPVSSRLGALDNEWRELGLAAGSRPG